MAGITEAIVDTIGTPILVLDRDARVVLPNRAFCHGFGVIQEETFGQCVYDLGNGQWNITEAEARTREIVASHEFADKLIDSIREGLVLLRRDLAAHGWCGEGRVTLRGPEAQLSRNQAQALAMVIHELATNALKYSALSVPGGRLAVEWGLTSQRHLELVWRESGVGSVVPPAEVGFGTAMIGRTIDYFLQGKSRLEFAPDGLIFRFTIPLEGITQTEG